MARTLDVLTTCLEYHEICRRIIHELSSEQVKHWSFDDWQSVDWKQMQRSRGTYLLVISRLRDFPTQPPPRPPRTGNRIRRHLIFTNDLPTEALPSRMARLDIRDPSRLHVADLSTKQTDSKTIEAIIRRAISGLASSNDDRIVDAWWESNEFVVLSPNFERLYVPSAKLSKFIGAERSMTDKYEVDPDGSFVYWPQFDVHLGWTQFLRLVDPSAAIDAQKKNEEFNKRYGAAIRRVRIEHGLRQSDVPGLTLRQIGRIEKGECRATRKALTRLAEAHRLELNEYLARLADVDVGVQ